MAVTPTILREPASQESKSGRADRGNRGRTPEDSDESGGLSTPLIRSVMARRNKKKFILIVYLFGMFCMTHLDLTGFGLKHTNFRSMDVFILDKLIHFFGYAGLTFIALFTATGKRLVQGRIRLTSAKRVLVWSFIVLLYALADELTQPLFNRSFDGYDLIADAVGISIGQTLFVYCESFGMRTFIERLR